MKTNPVIFIVGPTATGKTNAALAVAAKFIQSGLCTGVDVLSADSRQVYRGLEIISGADLPDGFSLKSSPDHARSFFSNHDGSISIHGISMHQPDEEWSLGQFREFGQSLLAETWRVGRIPIVVGGTGLYATKLLSTEAEIAVKPNLSLRSELEKNTLEQLQLRVKSSFPDHFNQLNHSDLHNPRRLMRLIERLSSDQDVDASVSMLPSNIHPVWIGLTLQLEKISERISDRIEARWEAGVVEEITALQNSALSTAPALSATGVSQVLDFIEGKLSKSEATQHWLLAERQYAKRQLTWWNKHAELVIPFKWFQADQPKIVDSIWRYLNAILVS